MRYLEVRWDHSLPDEPVLIYSEIDDDGWEVRKVEQYASGRRDLAGPDILTGSTVLSETQLPRLAEINAQSEFGGRLITREEFEAVWADASHWFDEA